jgi:PBP1b-binding outer membrane lipoprotein LpoB
MKKIICILASAALLGACEERTEVAAPASDKKSEEKTAIPEKKVDPNTFSRPQKPTLTSAVKPDLGATTATSSPTP